MSHTQGASAPIVAQFTPSFSIRIVTREGEPWFVAKDVAEALDYTWTGTQRIKHVPEEWRGVTSVVTPSGQQEVAMLSEPGLYFFLARSDKPKALPFQKWLAGEVLLSIRKTGTYTAKPAQHQPPVFLTHQDMENLTRLVWIVSVQPDHLPPRDVEMYTYPFPEEMDTCTHGWRSRRGEHGGGIPRNSSGRQSKRACSRACR